MTDSDDEPTVRVSRSGTEPDDGTTVSRRRGGPGPVGGDAADWSTAPAAGRTGSAGDPEGIDTGGMTEEEGSTVVARRESRRRQARAGAAQPARVPAEGGEAAVRAPDQRRTVSAVRRPVPVIVPRATAVARPPQTYVDTAAEEAARRRRGRRQAAFALVAASAVTLAAAAALIFLTTVG